MWGKDRLNCTRVENSFAAEIKGDWNNRRESPGPIFLCMENRVTKKGLVLFSRCYIPSLRLHGARPGLDLVYEHFL